MLSETFAHLKFDAAHFKNVGTDVYHCVTSPPHLTISERLGAEEANCFSFSFPTIAQHRILA